MSGNALKILQLPTPAVALGSPTVVPVVKPKPLDNLSTSASAKYAKSNALLTSLAKP